MKTQIVKLTALVFILIGILTPFILLENIGGKVLAVPLTPPVTTPVTPTNTPTPTPVKDYFQFLALKNPVLVNEKFFLNWVWTKLGNPAAAITFKTTIPEGIYLNWNDQCRSGKGCVVNYTLYNDGTAGGTVVTDAKGLRKGTFRLTTEYTELNGNSGAKIIDLIVNEIITPTPSAVPTSTSTPTVVPTIIPTATPTPVLRNRNPMILNWNLAVVHRGKRYNEKIYTIDLDRDNISVTISGLPAGLSYECLGKSGYTTCDISGVVRTSGNVNFIVYVTARDSRNGVTTKRYNLMIR